MFIKGKNLLPSFKAIDTSNFEVETKFEELLQKFVNQESINIDEIDINEFLKLFKKNFYNEANNFIENAINYYFSHPEVLLRIQEGNATLFPNFKALPDIDYDLLIPVVNRDC
jgi:hypothetical protein